MCRTANQTCGQALESAARDETPPTDVDHKAKAANGLRTPRSRLNQRFLPDPLSISGIPLIHPGAPPTLPDGTPSIGLYY